MSFAVNWISTGPGGNWFGKISIVDNQSVMFARQIDLQRADHAQTHSKKNPPHFCEGRTKLTNLSKLNFN